MCGATSAQTNLQNEQTEFYQQAMQQQSTVYGEDQGILKAMTDAYEPIVAAGPNQKGFSDAEENSLNTQATEGVATNYAHASKALRENLAAEGGGDTFLPTGASAELQGNLASSAADTQSSEQQQILQADYNQGYSEWQTAGEGLATTAGQLSPTSYSGAATGAGTAAANTANQVASENNSWVNAAIGAAGDIASNSKYLGA